MPAPMPPAIVAHVAHAVVIRRAWNTGIIVPRDTYAHPRRRRARGKRALQTLAILETQALGIPLETLDAPWDEKPVCDPDAGAVPERCPLLPRDHHAALSPPGVAMPPPPHGCG